MTSGNTHRKLTSQQGASLPLALLLFLVCAALSAVVLAAATAAAGRYSELPDYDQRYYSVTSAAQLLRDELDGRVVTLVCEKKYDSNSRDTPLSYTCKIHDGDTPEKELDKASSLLEKALANIVTANGEPPYDWKGRISPSDSISLFYIEPPAGQLSDKNKSDLRVSVTQLFEDGTVSYTLQSPAASGDNSAPIDTYYVTLKLAPDVEVYEDKSTYGGSQVKELTDTKTFRVTWQVVSFGNGGVS